MFSTKLEDADALAGTGAWKIIQQALLPLLWRCSRITEPAATLAEDDDHPQMEKVADRENTVPYGESSIRVLFGDSYMLIGGGVYHRNWHS